MRVALFAIMSDPVTYILPIKSSAPETSSELRAYIASFAERTEVIVVDGSSDEIFAAHEREWGAGVRHVAPAPDLISPMGKVGGCSRAFASPRTKRSSLRMTTCVTAMNRSRRLSPPSRPADVVRPQNYFEPLPWHARWDSGRMLLNRLTGGDWPGTLCVRRSRLQATNGYDGSVMFENLELVRTVLASGGRERVLYGAYVLRRPSTTRHFWSQRVRQAYNEIARPTRFVVQLAVLPIVLALVITHHWIAIAIGAAAIVAAAEIGRRREGATRVFPAALRSSPRCGSPSALCAAGSHSGARIFLGGVPYRGTILHRAATPMRVLRRRFANHPETTERSVSPTTPRRSA